jgi:hypothetical protein
MKKTLVRTLKLPLYHFDLMVAIGETVEKAIESTPKLRSLKHSDYDYTNMLGCYAWHSDKQIYAVILAEDAKLDTIAHESSHAAFHLLQSIGIKLADSSEEAFTYLIGYYTNEISKIMIQYKEQNDGKRKTEKVRK